MDVGPDELADEPVRYSRERPHAITLRFGTKEELDKIAEYAIKHGLTFAQASGKEPVF